MYTLHCRRDSKYIHVRLVSFCFSPPSQKTPSLTQFNSIHSLLSAPRVAPSARTPSGTHLFENALQRGAIPNVDRIEHNVLARDDLDASQRLRQRGARFAVRIAQVVDDHRTMAGVEQLQHGVGAHISGATRYQDGQGHGVEIV